MAGERPKFVLSITQKERTMGDTPYQQARTKLCAAGLNHNTTARALQAARAAGDGTAEAAKIAHESNIHAFALAEERVHYTGISEGVYDENGRQILSR